MSEFKTSVITEGEMPLVLEPKSPLKREEFKELLQEENPFIRENIKKYGCVLFRNCPIDGAEEFNETVDLLKVGEKVNYIGGDSPRTKIKGAVYTSTEAPPGIKIPLHNELSFQKYFPKHICFYCDIPPKTGGETFVGDARKIYRGVDPGVRERFEKGGLKYISRYYHKSFIMDMMNRLQKGHKNWIDVFETDSKKEVEKRCLEKNFDFRWLENDWIEISQVGPTWIEHPETKEKVWFNQIHLYDYNPKFIGLMRYIGLKMFYCRKNTLVHEAAFTNGRPIPRKDLYHVMDVLDKNSVYFPWKRGDLMVCDNILAMHGRAPFVGPRRILTAMTS